MEAAVGATAAGWIAEHPELPAIGNRKLRHLKTRRLSFNPCFRPVSSRDRRRIPRAGQIQLLNLKPQ